MLIIKELIALLQGLNEMIHVNLEQCLTHSKPLLLLLLKEVIFVLNILLYTLNLFHFILYLPFASYFSS